MKITHKVGFSYYTLDFNKEEAALWKATNSLPKFEKKIARKKIFGEVFDRIHFGGADGFKNALNKLESSLREFNQRISG